MRPILAVILGLVMGGLASASHLLLLRHALARATGEDGDRARRIILRGLPLRLLITTPFLVVAATAGLFSCVGLVIGLGLGRWFAVRSHSRPARATTS